MDLIAVQSGLTAWTPSQEVHGYSHDTETRAHNQYTDRFVVGRASTWIKIWGYTAKTEMTYDTDLAWPHLTTPAPAPRAQIKVAGFHRPPGQTYIVSDDLRQ